ncbi:MAG TPA: hypothetical protein DHW78_00430 [Ruminococcaceae bacterium]|nr:hypothetical protein [Oscillospiraceae bacterium]HCM22780.1 hypothetical protein [Oscillospiraceae bacterium]
MLFTFYADPTEIQKIIYTTNIIEGLNRQFRRITETSRPSRMTIPCAKCCIWRRKSL